MSLAKASTRIGIFALLLSVIVLSLFGSLTAADRALAAADREAIRLDAHGAALVAERELRLKAQTLSELFGPLLPSTTARRDSSRAPAGFDAVWVLDTRNRIVWRQIAPSAMAIDSATLARAAAEMTTTVWPSLYAAINPRDSAVGGILLSVPLSHRGVSLGIAVGYLAGNKLLAVLQDTVVARPWIALRTAGRLIASIGASTGGDSYLKASSGVGLSGDPIVVEVAHAQSGRVLRTTLWMLGVLALAALLAGLARERRQAV